MALHRHPSRQIYNQQHRRQWRHCINSMGDHQRIFRLPLYNVNHHGKQWSSVVGFQPDLNWQGLQVRGYWRYKTGVQSYHNLNQLTAAFLRCCGMQWLA
jgi:hypothetical protein